MVLPGSHRSDTPAYEQVLISRDDGHRAIVQVKTGATSVDLEQLRKAAANDARAFAYSATDTYVGKRVGIHIIGEIGKGEREFCVGILVRQQGSR
jgi:hypothetical protein